MDALAHRVPEAAARIGIGRTKLLEEVAEGKIQVVRVGRRVLITEDELRRYISALVETEPRSAA